MQIKNNLSKSYYFEHAHICRPLWTYIAQEKGSEIFSYFYSGGTSQIVFDKSISKSPTPKFQNLNWPNYLFWDKYQSDFFNEICIQPCKYNISGPLCKQINPWIKRLYSVINQFRYLILVLKEILCVWNHYNKWFFTHQTLPF